MNFSDDFAIEESCGASLSVPHHLRSTGLRLASSDRDNPLSLCSNSTSTLSQTLQTLKLLPTSTKILTLLSKHSLVITVLPSDSIISLNNVKITTGSPIYDDGFLIILEVENLFDPNYQFLTPISVPFPNLICGSSSLVNGTSTIGFPGDSWFEGARGVLRSNGYAVMASFFDLQLVGFKNSSMLTIFAPLDQEMENPLKDLSELSMILFW